MAPVVVMLFAPRASTPAVVVMVTGLALVPTEPLRVSPVLSVRLKAPPRVTLPSVVMELVPVPLGTSGDGAARVRRQRPGGDPRVQVLRHRPRDVPRAQHHRARSR